MSSQGFASKLGIHANNPTEVAYEFESENLAAEGQIIDTSGIRGTRSHVSERTRTGPYTVGGQLTMYPTPVELDTLLPWILGTAENADVFALAETVPARYIQIDRVAKVFTYAGCYVNRATFRSSEGGPLQLVLDIIGTSETVGNSGTFPSISPELTVGPYIHPDGAFTMQSSSRNVRTCEITIDNRLDVKFNNSLTASSIVAGDRLITVSVETPYTSSETALYDQALAGAAASFVYTNGARSLTFAFATLQVPKQSPTVPGKTDIPLRLSMVARKVSTTMELVCTNDSSG